MSTSQPHVRRAEAADVDEVAELYLELFGHQHAGQPGLFVDLAQPSAAQRQGLRTFVRGLLQHDDAMLLLAVDDEAVLGLVYVRLKRLEASDAPPFRHAACEAWIQHVVVARAARRRGVGRLLDQAARDWAREQGASSIGLQVWSFNSSAAAFFASLGYLERSRQLYSGL